MPCIVDDCIVLCTGYSATPSNNCGPSAGVHEWPNEGHGQRDCDTCEDNRPVPPPQLGYHCVSEIGECPIQEQSI